MFFFDVVGPTIRVFWSSSYTSLHLSSPCNPASGLQYVNQVIRYIDMSLLVYKLTGPFVTSTATVCSAEFYHSGGARPAPLSGMLYTYKK